MCGRYGYTNKNKESIKKQFRLKQIEFDLIPRYNICPGQDIPVILNENPESLIQARWGLIPFWAKDEKIGYKMINARSETIFEKPSFRNAIKKKRCVILADCFFEWKRDDDIKQPYCIRLKNKDTFAFAGIWDCWHDELISCSIITCEPNSLMNKIHDRMPVIIDDTKSWLDSSTEIEDIKKIMKPFSASKMEAFKISSQVNSPKNITADLLKPIK